MPFKDRTNIKYGKLTAIEYLGKSMWKCKCDCGEEKIVYGGHLESGHTNIINMCAQYNYGYDGKKYTSYEAFWNCLNEIKEKVPKGSKIGFPYKIGCDRGGANWQVIYTMISEVLSKDYEVEIYKLGEW